MVGTQHSLLSNFRSFFNWVLIYLFIFVFELGIKLEFQEKLLGGAALDATGVPLPDDTLSAAKQSDAVLLGAIGGYLTYFSYQFQIFCFIFCFIFYVVCVIVLFDFVQRYKWDKNEKHLKPETGLLQLREGLQVFANLRPATVFPQVNFLSYCILSFLLWY